MRALAFRAALSALESCLRPCRGKVGNECLAGDRNLSFADQHARFFGKINIDAGSETDHADALSRANTVAFAREANDSARDQAGDLNGGEALTAAGDDQECISLVMFAGLVEIGADEFAGAIGDPLNPSGDWTSIHVTVEYAHENRNARQRLLAEIEFRWRRHTRNLANPAVGRRHHNALTDGRHPRRIAKKINAPQCRDHADPTERRP